MKRQFQKEFKYNLRDFLTEEAFKKWQLLNTQIAAMKTEIDDAFRKSPMYAFTTSVQGEDDAKQQVPYIEESVLNTLLHGKLLSDKEKRQLLIDRGYIKDESTIPAANHETITKDKNS